MEQKEINSQSMLPVGTILRGIYRIDSYLSSGGFGNTYVATNIEFDERVAIKEFFMKGVTQRDDDQTTVSVSNSENTNSFLEQKEKFKKEARRLRWLKNEHIVKVHDLFEENRTAYYVMDYIDGENLSERLKRTGKPMNKVEMNQILPQILDALKAVHDAGIWHLDLKPANIMIDKTGKVKLIDFGASKQFNAQKGGATTSTAISYTNGYAPREQMEQNYDKFGPWTDIYALGATLYYLLTNKRPPLPSDIDDDDSIDKHLSLPFPDGVDSGLKKLVLQLMQTNRKHRPQTISEVFVVLEQQFVMPEGEIEKPAGTKDKEPEGDEVTFLATPKRKETVIDKKKVTNDIKTPNTNSKKESLDLKEKRRKPKKAIWLLLLLLVIFFSLFYLNNCISVKHMEYETSIGKCIYTGSVDIQHRPNGKGKAYFYDGRFYEGNFSHGEMTGKDAYFKYKNGDVFKGEFWNNSFHWGTYTLAKDKSYFIGYYINGQPDYGIWYDKNGNIIERINSTNDEE